MSKTMAWAIANRYDEVFAWRVFETRGEAIRHECWNLAAVRAVRRDYYGLKPWMHLDSREVSRAWRRIKRVHGLRAVRVLIEAHPKYLEPTP